MDFDVKQANMEAYELSQKINALCINNSRIVCLEALTKVFTHLLKCTSDEMTSEGLKKDDINEAMETVIKTFTDAVRKKVQKYDS